MLNRFNLGFYSTDKHESAHTVVMQTEAQAHLPVVSESMRIILCFAARLRSVRTNEVLFMFADQC